MRFDNIHKPALILSLSASLTVTAVEIINYLLPDYFKLDFFGIIIVVFSAVFLFTLTQLRYFVKSADSLHDKKDFEINILKENEKYRKEFLGNVSHELKTPIFNIQGYILTLLDGAVHEPEFNIKYLQRTEKNIDRIINILNDLDTITKIESGILTLEYKIFDIAELVKEIFDMLQIKADENLTEFVLVKETTDTNVYADRAKISQVLINLISNSIRYGKKSGRTKVRLRESKKNIIIDVVDNGIGISNEDLPRIFERFYRVDKSRSQNSGGTGLGLSIVKHIIEAHKQKITVDSITNVGTVFTFTLNKAKNE